MKPPRLRPGDTVGIISPSSGSAAVFPHRVERGIAQLRELGFEVKLGRHALNKDGFVSDTARNRAADIHELFADPDVKMILAAIGGDHSCHILPELDFDLIREHPKVFMGYSDVTVLNVVIWKETGLTTFDGPALLADFAEQPRIFDYTKEWFQQAVCSGDPIGIIRPAEAWTEEFLDWREKKDLERPRRMEPSSGWTWIRRGVSEGILVGGCLESLQHLRGTSYWPDWDGVILFTETSEEAPSPAKVDGILMDYENMGVFDRIRGLLIGRPMRYTEAQREELRRVVRARTEGYTFPVLMDMDFGHTAPRITLPIGCTARMDGGARTFAIIEPAVR
jgi:muramoyltetrapeptide carboxypeptidase